MKYLHSVILTLVFSFLASSSFAQIGPPDPSGTEEWDYCECVEGIQSVTDICPCEQIFPPNTTNNNNTNNNSGTGVPDPTGSSGGGGTTFEDLLESLGLDYCHFFPWNC